MPIGRQEKIVLGIDPGLADTGYGVICQNGNDISVVAYGSIKTAAKQPLAKRLEIIEHQINHIIQKYKPSRAGVEQLFFCTNVKTAIAVGQARGVVLLTLSKNKIPLTECTPLQVKQAVTGYGQADKKQIQQMVKTILKLKELPRPDDAADALAIAICVGNQSFLN